MEPVDFNINAKFISIDFECPYCEDIVAIPWRNLDVPEHFDDDWGEVKCPCCGNVIELGDYEYD